MTLAEIVRQKVADSPPRSERHDFLAADDKAGWSLTLTLQRRDEVASLVWEMVLHRTGAAPAAETLSSWAERIACQATGLLEPLKVLEIDSLRNEGLLRSQAPSRRQQTSSYYEILLQGNEWVWVRRYQAQNQDKREQVAFALTHDALAKLVEDLTTIK